MTEKTLQQICEELCSELSGHIKFKPDDRFVAALGEFKKKDEDKTYETLGKHFVQVWKSDNIETAPEDVVAATQTLGGLFGGQLFMTKEIEEGVLLFCAWWPWSNGSTISIRIGPYFSIMEDEEKQRSNNEFMSWFGL